MCPRQESNLRPSGPQPDALSTGLRGRIVMFYSFPNPIVRVKPCSSGCKSIKISLCYPGIALLNFYDFYSKFQNFTLRNLVWKRVETKERFHLEVFFKNVNQANGVSLFGDKLFQGFSYFYGIFGSDRNMHIGSEVCIGMETDYFSFSGFIENPE